MDLECVVVVVGLVLDKILALQELRFEVERIDLLIVVVSAAVSVVFLVVSFEL